MLKRFPSLDGRFLKVLAALKDDPFTHSLRTHRLTGSLDGLYACSLTGNIRIVFALTDDLVHLLNIGTHDEVY
jgi:mRNA-degrading endonuclease YafQ of YafQ-DinJ toxin-antitoxin module